MKSIDSFEVFSKPTLSRGDPPKHTVEGHEKCYYYQLSRPLDTEGLDLEVVMKCPHGELATGGFVSEDHFNLLRLLTLEMMTEFANGRPLAMVDRTNIQRVRALLEPAKDIL